MKTNFQAKIAMIGGLMPYNKLFIFCAMAGCVGEVGDQFINIFIDCSEIGKKNKFFDFTQTFKEKIIREVDAYHWKFFIFVEKANKADLILKFDIIKKEGVRSPRMKWVNGPYLKKLFKDAQKLLTTKKVERKFSPVIVENSNAPSIFKTDKVYEVFGLDSFLVKCAHTFFFKQVIAAAK